MLWIQDYVNRGWGDGKLLEIKDLKVSFQTFLRGGGSTGVSFHVNKGETVALVGESGCGKSVTASSIMQLLPMPPAFYKGGEIYLMERYS